MARNIATALCHQYLQKNTVVWNIGMISPEMERYTASVLQEVNPELYARLIENKPPGQYRFGTVRNTKEIRDALNNAR